MINDHPRTLSSAAIEASGSSRRPTLSVMVALAALRFVDLAATSCGVRVVPLQHDVLGVVEFDSVDGPDRWESGIPWLDDTIGVAITVDGAAMDQRTLDRVGRYVTDLAEFDRTARTAMRTAMRTTVNDDSAVRTIWSILSTTQT